MKRRLHFKLTIGCVMILMALVSWGQDFSLDDNPNAPLTGPFVAGFYTAEDELGLNLPATMAGLIGPSPTLPLGPFFDSDMLTVMAPGGPPVFSMGIPGYPYVDGVSANHASLHISQCIWVGIRFSIDRATGGIAGSASFAEALANQQPADIYDSSWAYAHPANFVPLMPPAVPPYGGPLPPAGTGISNILANDDSFFGLLTGGAVNPPAPFVAPPIAPGGNHDNIDAYNDYPGPLPLAGDVFFTVHHVEMASPPMSGANSADIFILPGGAGPAAVFATAAQVGMVNGCESIDGFVMWDYGIPGVCEPGVDFMLFTMAPGSGSLPLAPGADPGTIFLTDFQGFFYTFIWSADLGLAPLPAPPLLGNPQDVNVDALEAFQS